MFYVYSCYKEFLNPPYLKDWNYLCYFKDTQEHTYTYAIRKDLLINIIQTMVQV